MRQETTKQPHTTHQTHTALAFDTIREMLAENASTTVARERLRALMPTLSEAECAAWQDRTGEARALLEALGPPPLSSMEVLEQLLPTLQSGGLLTPAELLAINQFLASARRVKAYLKRGEYLQLGLTGLGQGLTDLPELTGEIERCIRGDMVDSHASKALFQLRARCEALRGQIKTRLNTMLQRNKKWFSDTLVVTRGDRLALPVRREYRNQVPGAVLDVSASGSTCFIEPQAVGKLQQELQEALLDEENEARRILYQLTALAQDALPTLRQNREMLEALDFDFAKGKLSLQMNAVAPRITMERRLLLREARHPLLPEDRCVPLRIQMEGDTRGVVITGPNTGGKTVTLKTVGLLVLMAQSGLQVPAEEAELPMCSQVLSDIGDGQSISENLSTFSAHMTNILDILGRADAQSLVLLDELGSGTDPTEGMGIAIAILEALRERGCLMVVTTHYPEVKEYAQRTAGLVNARMAFDRENLSPLYRLEMGEAGESCALYIAKRLGFPRELLRNAYQAAYRGEHPKAAAPKDEGALEALQRGAAGEIARKSGPRLRQRPEERGQSERALSFQLGDSVSVLPDGEPGIVYAPANEQGEVGVQCRGEKRRVPYKRLRLRVAASELYPEDYDFSILFDTVANRKARKQLGKGHRPQAQVVYEKEP